MSTSQDPRTASHRLRTLAWWLAGSVVLLAALWAGPTAWAATAGTCGSEPSGTIGTIPTPCGVDDGAGTTFETPVTISVLANDLDAYNTGLRIESASDPANGAVVVNRSAGVSDTITYTPDPGFSGPDRFNYTLSTVYDGNQFVATAEVVVRVARPGEPAPIVDLFDPGVDNTFQYPQFTTLPDGTRVPLTITVQVATGTLTYTVGTTDTLAIVFAPVLTPTGPTGSPPPAALRQSAASAPSALNYTNLTFVLDILFNRISVGKIGLNKPVTITIGYSDETFPGLDENTLSPYYWNGSAWSNTGIVIVNRDPANNRFVFTLDRLVGEISFFAQPAPSMLNLPLIRRSTLIYASNFPAGTAAQWTPPQLTAAPNGRRFLGEFGNQTVRLALQNLAPHSAVSVQFDLYLLRSWDGDQVTMPPGFNPYASWAQLDPASRIGPDRFRVRSGDLQLMDNTFSNWRSFKQSYPAANSPGQTGAAQVNSLGYRYRNIPQDAIYPISLSFAHTGANLELEFLAEGLQVLDDESWGLGSVTVTLH